MPVIAKDFCGIYRSSPRIVLRGSLRASVIVSIPCVGDGTRSERGESKLTQLGIITEAASISATNFVGARAPQGLGCPSPTFYRPGQILSDPGVCDEDRP